ncbi:sigma 54-interacting transcriptional regulator [Clostridium sp. Marseille-Q2269]|uniref:sigma-54 interaction domain-containing protein n=1 Tax=Clostridium sp. Marseille-Q2269 TaxID=2942205 RepID=UPI00207457E5|nr:sigma 54-interacting transcriptional regulator [Clostridium sp. Marseille-Q2269]
MVNDDNTINLDNLFSNENSEKFLSVSVLQVAFNVAYEGLILVDNNYNIIKINTMGLNILNSTEDKLKGSSIKDILKNYGFIQDCLENGTHKFSIDSCFFIGNNSIRCITNIMAVRLHNSIVGAILTMRDTRHIHKLVNNVVGYKASYAFEDIITKNQKMKSIIELAKKASESDCSILIDGNSGTGKELFAQAIHNHSDRHHGPFVAVNCAAIPRELVESELFGYEKGAFTGASKGGYPGKFELADGGTIFLDEIGELPLDVQSKLLRVLDNLKIMRVGGTHEKKIDIRVLAATNRNLAEEVSNKNFRGDLYYRLNVINIHLIPLNDRVEDIEALTNYFIDKLNIKNPGNFKKIAPEFMDKLKCYSWPGNVRELRNVVERSYYICENNIITDKFLNSKLIKTGSVNCSVDEKEPIIPLDVLEHKAIKNALFHCKGNIVQASELLGISRATIYRKINKYNINVNY